MNEREDRSVSADAECQGEDCGDRESRCVTKLAQSVADVLCRDFKKRQSAHPVEIFFRLRDSTELA
jgi:hypothetical protein